MTEIVSFIKEYDFLFTIVFSAIAAVFAVMSYFQIKRNDKESIRRKIKEKRAQLNGLESVHLGLDHTTVSDNIAKQFVLRSEIDELEKML